MAAPAAPAQPALLTTHALGKRFGAVSALAGLDFVGRRGQVHALTGANGAGKSTLMNLLSGVHVPSEGEIRIEGQRVRFDSPAQARAAGVSAVYQELTVLPELSVAENIWIGHEPRSRFGLLDRKALLLNSARLLDEFGLPLQPASLAGSLNIASRQLLEIARALSISARILSLDEPTAVLSAKERARLFRIVAELKRRGLLILFVSHRLEEVFEIADEVTVLRNGRHAFSGPTIGLRREELVRHMVGHDVDERSVMARFDGAPEPHISVRIHEPEATLELRKGEIVGFAGLVGAGRTRLARRIAGLEAGVELDCRISMRQFSVTSAATAVANGIVYLTEDRKRDGLFGALSVLHNASAAALPCTMGVIDQRKERQTVQPMLQRLKLVAASLRAPVRSLSGGNQQKLLFARALLARPTLLICDEPTRGVDVAAREEIYALIEDLSRQGVTLIVISSELKELRALCHRLLVIHEAGVIAELPGSASEADIVDAAIGGPQQPVPG